MQHISFHADPRNFLDLWGEVLKQDAVAHNLILSLCTADMHGMEKGKDPHVECCALSDDTGFVIAAAQRPPRNLILSRARHLEIAPLAAFLAKRQSSFPGIVGPEDVVAAFAAAWERLTGQRFVKYMNQMIYALHAVRMPHAVAGQFRFAQARDAGQLAEWISAFSKSALPEMEHVGVEDAEQKAIDLIAAQRLALWTVNGLPVAQAAFTGTDEVARIGLVYTPPENRRHGYASAVVAHLSMLLLERGDKMCCLYTDAANSVANDIYRKIGYKVAGRSCHYLRGDASSASLNAPQTRT